MRKIEFRAWNPQTKRMTEWNEIQKLRNLQKLMSLEHVILEQYTGLKDKNGVKIFEGDIFTVHGKYPKVVKYISDRACFCVANIDQLQFEDTFDIWQSPASGWWRDFKDSVEVVGNIHENKELLK